MVKNCGWTLKIKLASLWLLNMLCVLQHNCNTLILCELPIDVLHTKNVLNSVSDIFQIILIKKKSCKDNYLRKMHLKIKSLDYIKLFF